MNRRFYIAVIAALCVLSCYLYYLYMTTKAQYVDLMLTAQLNSAPAPQAEEAVETVTFHISGEVRNPDVYSLPKGSRIIDAINAAGGSTDQASVDMLESAASKITDGQKIYVPNVSDDIDKIKYMNNNSSSGSKSALPDNFIVNINTADEEELAMLPGIGLATAEIILEYRRENGSFTMIEDIKNVPRIGEKTFEGIRDKITVDGE